MSLDSKIWLDTLPNIKKTNREENYNLDSERWVNTLPAKKTKNRIRGYLITVTFIVFGLILVPVIKNKTRSLQKEINKLHVSINEIKSDLHKAELDYEVITSPKNISNLAKEYLESDLVHYNKSQIKEIGEEDNLYTKLQVIENGNKIEKITNKAKKSIKKKIEKQKAELKKLEDIYANPSSLPKEVKLQIAQRIENTKKKISDLKESPKDIFTPSKIAKWTGIQIVKAFFGIPVIPGK